MLDLRRDRLLLFGGSAFHAALFLVVVLVLLYRGGGLAFTVGDLGLSGGLLLYGLLLVATVVGTRTSLSFLTAPLLEAGPGRLVLAGARGGAVTGLLVASVLALAESAVLVLALGPSALLAPLVFVCYVLLAGAAGCAFGAATGLIDSAIIALVLQSAARAP